MLASGSALWLFLAGGEEVKNLVELGIKQLAQSDDWNAREVAGTCLVKISKKRKEEVIIVMTGWVEDSIANVRMTAVEGLRDIARKEPEAVLPILEEAKNDDNLYVKKSVANVLRNASRQSHLLNPES